MKRRDFFTTAAAALLAGTASADVEGPGVAVIFVGTSWCPYCAQIAPLLAPLQSEAGVPVLVASLDNKPIAPFADFVNGQMHPLSRGFERVPQVLIYNQKHDEITHVVGNYRSPRHFVQLLGLALSQSSEL